MKQKFNLIVILLTVLTLSLYAKGEENSRKFSKSWPVGSVETLRINNKFGEVKINNGGGNSVTVEVVVTAEGSANQINKILDEIAVEFGSEGSTATAETHIEEGKRSGSKFSVDYTVNIPPQKNLDITNKFGNVVVSQLTGKGKFDIAFGNLTAAGLHGPETRLEVAYGKADIQSMSKAVVNLAFSKMVLVSGTDIDLDSKNSSVNADKLNELQLDSKFDSFDFGEINSMGGSSKFTNYKIEKLNKRLNLQSAYGTVKVESIPAGFENLEVNSSYAQISLGIDETAGYEVNARCDFCDIDYPKDKFKGNRMQENTSQQVQGKVSSGIPGKVVVTSKYGNIRLTK